ncbi:MAG: TldD/PmbA family protein [Actinobacteria bacterium]|nr:TldD/PmbA family protein [Actinomycetota bacterium]
MRDGADLLDDADVAAVLRSALATGGGFAEVYAEHRQGRSLRLEDAKVEEVTSGVDRGAGVRVVRDGRTAYAYTNVLTRASLEEAAAVAAAGVGGQARTRVADLVTVRPPVTHPPARDPFEADRPWLVDVVTRADEAARSVAPSVRQATVRWADSHQDVLVANSEGHRSTERRIRCRIVVQVVAARDGVVQTGMESPGGSVGLELLDEHPPERVGRLAAQRAVEMLDAEPAPAGELAVVLGPGSGGVLFHEACGHGMEADLVARGASVYAGRRGERVGTAALTGVDDATVLGGWGSFGFDDEGTPAQRTVLFDDGVCTDYLTDRLRARELELPRSGNGRRQSYAHLPVPRMTNTFILPGADDPAEIVRGVRRGVYCDELGGGQVDTTSGDFVFGVAQAHMIENGRLTRPIRGANLVGDGPTVLARIEGIGSDFGMRQGVCGKEGQGVPAGLGNPTLLVGRLTVGGTSR